jgi:TM2 domain-containing membrane protein YozV
MAQPPPNLPPTPGDNPATVRTQVGGASRRARRPAPYKNPATAAAIAALSPGSGQLWVGDLGRGLLMFFLAFFCGIGYFWGIYDAYRLAQKANRGEFEATDKYVIHALLTLPTVLVVILVAMGGLVLWREWSLVQNYFRLLHQIVS